MAVPVGDTPARWLRLEGHSGGVLYLACPMSEVRCSVGALRALHEDLERLCGDDPAAGRSSRDAEPPTEEAFIIRRMALCGTVRISDVFVRAGVSDRILEVLEGRRERLGSVEELGLFRVQVEEQR